MKYRITIEEIIEVEGKSYPDTKEIYSQVVEERTDLVKEVAAVVNVLTA